jgi:hypothetical protein
LQPRQATQIRNVLVGACRRTEGQSIQYRRTGDPPSELSLREYAAASLNHAPGRHVVVVARHQDTLDAFGARDHEALSEDFGRVAMPPVFR